MNTAKMYWLFWGNNNTSTFQQLLHHSFRQFLHKVQKGKLLKNTEKKKNLNRSTLSVIFNEACIRGGCCPNTHLYIHT